MLIVQLARWASNLQNIPPSILEKEQQRHLFLASQCGEQADFPGRVASLLKEGRFPYQLGGMIGPVSVPMCWQEKPHVDDMLNATLCGAEVASRLGIALLLADPFLRQSLVSVTSAVISLAKLRKCSPQQMAHAWAIALVAAPRLQEATLQRALGSFFVAVEAVAQGAVSAAQKGYQGDLSWLDDPSGPLAFSGCLQGPWMRQQDLFFTSTLILGAECGPPSIRPALQALDEILQRHRKAADKRLRWDQITKIEIQLPYVEPGVAGTEISLLSQSRAFSVPWSIGCWVVDYEYKAHDQKWLDQNRDRIFHVASKVELIEDAKRSFRFWQLAVQTLGPAFAGVDSEVMFQFIFGEQLSYLESIQYKYQLRSLLKNTSKDFRLDEFQFQFPTEVRLYTTRGGMWPERRFLPTGGPGSSKEETLQRIQHKYAKALPTITDDWLIKALHAIAN